MITADVIRSGRESQIEIIETMIEQIKKRVFSHQCELRDTLEPTTRDKLRDDLSVLFRCIATLKKQRLDLILENMHATIAEEERVASR